MFVSKVRLFPLTYQFVNLPSQTNMVPQIYRDSSTLAEGSQNIINSTVALKQLHFTLCIHMAFADTADKNNRCQRTWGNVE